MNTGVHFPLGTGFIMRKGYLGWEITKERDPPPTVMNPAKPKIP